MAARSKTDPLPWVPLFPSTLLGLLSGMNAIEQVVFQTAFLRMCELNGPCPDSAVVLARRCAITQRAAKRAIVSLIKMGQLARADGALINSYALKLIADAQTKYEQKVAAVTKGGKKRAENTELNQQKRSASAELKQIHTQSHHTSDFLESREDMLITPEQRTELLRLWCETVGPDSSGLASRFINSNNGDFENKKSILERAARTRDPEAKIRKTLEVTTGAAVSLIDPLK